MPAQEPISPGQIKPESSREPQTSSRLQQTNVNLQAPPKSEERYKINRFFKADHAIIIPLTVQEILDEHIASKLA
jgi:hypothetical protein